MRQVRRRRNSLVAGVSLLLALVPIAVLATPLPAASCENVAGTFVFQGVPTATGFDVFLIDATGPLAGLDPGEQVAWITVERITAGGTILFTAEHRFETAAFGTFTTTDRGTVTPSGRITDILTITDGAAGKIHAHGWLDPATGIVEATYQGRVCTE